MGYGAERGVNDVKANPKTLLMEPILVELVTRRALPSTL